jgi:cytochrome c oxidase assembly protein subunit 15
MQPLTMNTGASFLTPSADGRVARRLMSRVVGFAVVVTLCLIMLGAWVRLTDAGLGCPDWPGCYGHLTPTRAADRINEAVQAQGGEHGPVSMGKAWREMIHRYIATFLGAVILLVAAYALWRRAALRQSPLLAVVLLGVVILQGLFGKWTVTLLLKPAIVTGHLIGGMLTFSLLLWLWLRQRPPTRYIDAEPVAALLWPARLALAAVVIQIVLGGWVSTNYAALACTDLPTCQGQWWPAVNFPDGFHVIRELGKTGDGENLSLQALTAIHLVHRIGAVAVALIVGWTAWRTLRTPGIGVLGLALLAMLTVQWVLGLSNVWFSLPLPVAVAHNGGAAVLLGLTLVLNFRARQARFRV